ncbi:outer membrane protein [Polycladidibacter hongkongensis]|uniref:outer membrane protein n=1 Tax=Polycladidibacter hongkongensis TaxID=1647556 RepID=UPI00082D0015|nr:outer membrane protein [Pseudovibrio hongkongensis]
MKRISIAAAAAVIATTAFAQDNNNAQDWAGAYLGAKSGYNFGAIGSPETSNEIEVNGAAFALFAGYNFATSDKLVLGLETSLGYNLSKKTEGTVGAHYSQFKRLFDVEAKARLGYAVDRFLPFASAGFGLSQQSFETSDVASSVKDKKTLVFFTAGAGLDYQVTNKVTLRGEYDYRHYGETKFKTTGDDTKVKGHDHRVTFGASYSF